MTNKKGLLAFFIGFAVVLVWVFMIGHTTVYDEKGMVFEVTPGMSRSAFTSQLAAQHIIHYPRALLIFTYVARRDLKKGEYLFKSGSTPFSIWSQVTRGRGFYLHPFAIIPGWSFKELRHQLAVATGLKATISNLSDQAVMAKLNSAQPSPEGEFYPDTYYYTKGIADFTILKTAYQRMQAHLMDSWQKRAFDIPYQTPYQALIAASIIEKEAYFDGERPVIAGVLVNRLNKDMYLQFDPTIIYGLGDRYDGKIHKENLLEDTPYNTYIHKGLPPTPIAIPSNASLMAALHPEKTDYYYFVARLDKSHQFSKSLVEHTAAIEAIQKMRDAHVTEQVH